VKILLVIVIVSVMCVGCASTGPHRCGARCSSPGGQGYIDKQFLEVKEAIRKVHMDITMGR